MKSKLGIKVLHSLHEHPTGFHYFIFCLESSSEVNSFMWECTSFQVLGPRKENVSFPYETVLIL